MLTHIDANNQPTMVDVTDKSVSTRVALAQTKMRLPMIMKPYFQGEELILKKGPVFQTAIIAGTMAAKRTHDIIPFCHHIPVESCKFKISLDADLLVTIVCEVKTTFKTGVEMEALHGATVAALTIYDMCKAVSTEIEILETKLISKVGGKRTILDRPTYGLVLTGGKSERMGTDKALIDYKGMPHAQYIHSLLDKHCDEVYLSARPGQWDGTALATLPMLHDGPEGTGPMAGIMAAFAKHPDANWIVAACDLVHFNEETIQGLLTHYQSDKVATAYKNIDKGFAEPLCTLYTPAARAIFRQAMGQDITCPVKALKLAEVVTVAQTGKVNLANINTVEERLGAQNEIC